MTLPCALKALLRAVHIGKPSSKHDYVVSANNSTPQLLVEGDVNDEKKSRRRRPVSCSMSFEDFSQLKTRPSKTKIKTRKSNLMLPLPRSIPRNTAEKLTKCTDEECDSGARKQSVVRASSPKPRRKSSRMDTRQSESFTSPAWATSVVPLSAPAPMISPIPDRTKSLYISSEAAKENARAPARDSNHESKQPYKSILLPRQQKPPHVRTSSISRSPAGILRQETEATNSKPHMQAMEVVMAPPHDSCTWHRIPAAKVKLCGQPSPMLRLKRNAHSGQKPPIRRRQSTQSRNCQVKPNMVRSRSLPLGDHFNSAQKEFVKQPSVAGVYVGGYDPKQSSFNTEQSKQDNDDMQTRIENRFPARYSTSLSVPSF